MISQNKIKFLWVMVIVGLSGEALLLAWLIFKKIFDSASGFYFPLP